MDFLPIMSFVLSSLGVVSFVVCKTFKNDDSFNKKYTFHYQNNARTLIFGVSLFSKSSKYAEYASCPTNNAHK